MSDDILQKLRIGIPGAAAGLIANFAPDPTLPGIAGYWPGVTAAEGLTSVGGRLYDAGANLINKSLGTNLPMAPDSFKALGERAAATEQQIYEQLGGAPAVTPMDETVRDMSSLAGAFAVPGLGAAKALKTAGIGAGLGGVGSIAQQALHPTEPTDIGIPAGAFSGGSETTTTAPVQEAKNSIIPQGAFSGGPTATDASPIPAGAFSDGGAVPGQVHAPAYSELGQSDTSVWDSLLDIGLIAAGIKGGHIAARHGARVGEAERILRVEDPQYLVQKNDYENAQVRKQAGDQISDPKATVPPVPSGKAANTLATKFMDYWMEAGAGVQNLEGLLADNPRASEKIKKQTATFINEQQRQVRFDQFIRTGHDPESGVSMPNPTRWAADMERLNREKFSVVNDGLAAAREIDRRKYMTAESKTPDPLNNRYDFHNSSIEQLEAIKGRMMADPVMAELANRSWQMRAAQLEMAKWHGFITEADAYKQSRMFPNYLPESDIKGQIVNDFNKTQFKSRGGLEEIKTKATALWSQQLEKFHHDIEINNWRRAIVDHITNAQDKTPDMVPLITKLDKRPVDTNAGRYIRVRRVTGEEWYRTEHPGVHEALVGDNVDKARIHFDSMGKARQLFQGLTTGTASLATGRVVPLRNLLFTAFQAPINATGGLYGGPVAALTHGKLPKTLTVPMDIPLNVVGAIGTWANGATKRLALHASDVFRPDNQNFMTQTIRGYVGDGPLANFSAAMHDYYMKSDFYAGHSRGLGGQSLQQRIRAPAMANQQKFFNWKEDEVTRLQMAKLVPSIVINMDAGVLGRNVRPFVIKLQNAVTSEFAHASEATHDFLYSLNKDNPAFHGDPNQVINAVRNVVGDPSVSGGGRAAQMLRTFIPYSNVIAQGTRAQVRAVAHNPIDTLAAMVTGFGTLSALSMLTAFQSQENLDHFTKETSAQDRAKFLHIYNGPHGENSLLRIPYPSESTWFTPLITEGMFHLFNIAGTPHDDEVHDDVLGFLKSFLWHHIDKTTTEGMKHGLNDAFNFLDIPPIVKFGITAPGGSGRIDFARAITDYQTGNLGLGSFVSSPHAITSLPNQSSDDAAAHGQNGKRWIEMAGSLFGLSNSIVQNLFNLDMYMKQGNSVWDSMGAAGADWKQMGKDYNPMGNTLLWDNATQLSKIPPIVEQTRRELHEMDKTRGARTGERMEGTTGGRNPLEVPVYATDQGKVPDDPTMRSMYMTVDAYLRHLDRTTLPEINTLEKQLREAVAVMVNPQEKRAWVNEQQRIIADKYRYVQREITRMNDDLSRIARTRVSIGKSIDWKGTVDQFMK